MANRYQTPVLFAMEKNVVYLSARVTFGPPYGVSGSTSSAAALDPNNSKGFCAIWPNTPTFTATVGSGASTFTSVSSFQGLFTGMQLFGGTIVGSGAFTIGTISAATGSIVMSNAAFVTAGSSSLFSAAGGQFILQFGTQAGVRLDTYAKLLEYDYNADESVGSTVGTATQVQLAPAFQTMFIIQNNTKVRTIPATLTSGSTDATVTVQFGSGQGIGFVAQNPTAGDSGRFVFVMGNSTAI